MIDAMIRLSLLSFILHHRLSTPSVILSNFQADPWGGAVGGGGGAGALALGAPAVQNDPWGAGSGGAGAVALSTSPTPAANQNRDELKLVS